MNRKNLFRHLFLATSILCGAGHVNAQSPTLDWVQQSGGKGFYAIGADVAVDKDGNTYSTGYFTGTVGFYQFKTTVNSTLTAFGENDAFIMKHDAKGAIQWIKQFGYSKSYAQGTSIAYDPNNDWVIVTGHFIDKAAYSTKEAPIASKGGQDIFVSVLDSKGGVVWTKSFGGPEYESSNAVAVDNDNNIYLTGSFQGKVDFDAKHSFTAAAFDDAFALSLSGKEGDLNWARHLVGGSSTDIGTSVCANGDAVFVTGIFNETAYFDYKNADKEMKSNGAEDIYLAKLSKKSGELEWLQFFGGSNDDYVYSVATDEKEGAAYITGRFSGKVDFNYNGGKEFNMEGDGKGNVFIAKYGAKSGLEWGKTFGGDSRDEGTSIKVDEEGNVYSYGRYLWNVDFNTGNGDKDTFFVRSEGSGDYIHKLDGNGEFQWVSVIEGKKGGNPTAAGMALGYDGGSIYVIGQYTGDVDFDPGPGEKFLPSIGNTDTYLSKLIQSNCNSSSSITTKACDSYTYNGTKYTTSGTYTHVYPNAAGCDSTVILMLTINKPSTRTLTVTECDSYPFDGKTLTTSGTYVQNTQTSQGCDSTVTLNLTIKKSSTQNLTETACDSFSLDKKLYYTKTGAYTHVFRTVSGCDSTINVNLTVNKSSATTISRTACVKFNLGNDEYTESGVYTLDLKTDNGCDSTVTLNLTINKVDLTVTKDDKVLTSNTVGASYQWLDCDKDMAPIAGETKQYFRATRNGNYAVEIKKNQCTETSECYAVSGFTGIQQINGKETMIYPNPASDRITLQCASMLNKSEISIVNVLGQSIVQLPNQSGAEISIDIQGLTPGVYFVVIKEGMEVAQLKFVKR